MRKEILEKIKTMREDKGLTLHDVANGIGYGSAKGYHDVESGKIKLRVEHLEKLSKFYQMPIKKFFD